MLVYRSFALGLLGACCLLLAMRPPVQAPGQIVFVSSREAPRCSAPMVIEPAPTIIDVAPGVTATQVAQLVMLAPGERIATIDDRPVANALDAGVALATIDLRSRRYLDLGVTGDRGARRVLVLLH